MGHDGALLFQGVVGLLLLLDLVNVKVGDFGILTIEDLGELLERGALGLNVKEVDEEELEEDPDSVESDEIVVMREVFPRDGIGVAGLY